MIKAIVKANLCKKILFPLILYFRIEIKCFLYVTRIFCNSKSAGNIWPTNIVDTNDIHMCMSALVYSVTKITFTFIM